MSLARLWPGARPLPWRPAAGKTRGGRRLSRYSQRRSPPLPPHAGPPPPLRGRRNPRRRAPPAVAGRGRAAPRPTQGAHQMSAPLRYPGTRRQASFERAQVRRREQTNPWMRVRSGPLLGPLRRSHRPPAAAHRAPGPHAPAPQRAPRRSLRKPDQKGRRERSRWRGAGRRRWAAEPRARGG
eukprot:scaffold4760_cov113-Isochrysis_galbana.AAC.12